LKQDFKRQKAAQKPEAHDHQAVSLAAGKAKVCSSQIEQLEAFGLREKKREDFANDYLHWLEKKLEVQASLKLEMGIVHSKQRTIELMAEGLPSEPLGDGRDGHFELTGALNDQLIEYASRLAELVHEKDRVEAEMEARARFFKVCSHIW
jgi:hypothetical protein